MRNDEPNIWAGVSLRMVKVPMIRFLILVASVALQIGCAESKKPTKDMTKAEEVIGELGELTDSINALPSAKDQVTEDKTSADGFYCFTSRRYFVGDEKGEFESTCAVTLDYCNYMLGNNKALNDDKIKTETTECKPTGNAWCSASPFGKEIIESKGLDAFHCFSSESDCKKLEALSGKTCTSATKWPVDPLGSRQDAPDAAGTVTTGEGKKTE